MHTRGVVLGRMTDEHRKQGGIWVIGNSPYNQDPQYPGRNGGSLLVKSWVAHRDKYGSGLYPIKDRAGDSVWEYVRVFTGCLELHIYDGDKIRRFPLQYPDDGVEIPPEIKRSWELPEWCEEATGITICRTLQKYPVKGGYGTDYEFVSWDSESAVNLIRLSWCPRNLNSWSVKYIEVFDGELAGVKSLGKQSLEIKAGSHIFLTPEIQIVSWHWPTFARGVVIHI